MYEKLCLLVGRFFPEGSFVRNAAILASGTSLAQLIIIASSPILSRIYSPSDFGIYAVFSSILAIAIIFSTFRYELAIPLPKNEKDSLNLVFLSLVLLTGSTLFTALMLFLFGYKIFSPLGVSSIFAIYLLLPIGVFVGGFFAILNYFAIRSKAFSSISIAKVFQAVYGVFFQLFGFKLGYYGLMGGIVLGQSVGCFSLLRSIFDKYSFKNISSDGIKKMFYRYKRFPIFSMPDALANTASVQLPAVLFAYFYSPAAAGFYLLADRVLQLPTSVIGSAVGQVFYGEASATQKKQDLFSTVMKLHAQLANIAIIPMLLLILLGPTVFEFVFGNDWRLAGEFARYMAPWIFLVFVASPFTSLFGILEKQSHGMYFQFMVLFLRITAISIGVFYGNLIITIALFSSVSAIAWILFLFWVSLELKGDFRLIMTSFLAATFKGIYVIFPLGLLAVLPKNTPDLLLATICIVGFLSIIKYYMGLLSGEKNR